ncbi:MAG: acetate--CoA ligase family protein, partial [Candidatus Eisenbacteria bacterium]|nr:acetate--CoA ligase family protein [Candidatus Eisenbacteria bacterium]
SALLGSPAPAGVVVKIQSPDILHKTETGGIAFAPPEASAIDRACSDVLERVRARAPQAKLDGLLLCEKIGYQPNLPGTEMLLSLRQDPALGPVVVLGLGGLLTEWYGKLAPSRTTWIVSAHDPLLDRAEPPDFASLGPAFALLFRASRLHDRPPVDGTLFWGAMRRWADLARTFGIDGNVSPFVLEEVEVNPLAALPGRPPVALDGIARWGTEKPRVRRRRIEKIANLLAPRSVAVIGASARAMNAGRIILQNLRTAEGVAYGKIWGVHPKEKEIDTIPCVPNVAALPERVDLAVVCVPAEGARDAIVDIVAHEKAHAIILIPGGFAETGQKQRAEEIVEALERGRELEDGGPILVGGNCLGIVSKRQYNTFFLPQYKLPFHAAPGDNLAAISQSGAYLVTLTSNLDGLIFPKASISYGNQMDVTVSDLLEHYLGDPGVQVLACYLEGFQPLDGLRFVDLVRKHREAGRTVIAFKAGKTALGAKAAASHTASLAGDYEVTRSLLSQAGAVVAETLNQFEDFTKAFTMLYDRTPAGRRLGLISNAGFECSTAMDALYALDLASFSEETRAKLAACLPDIAHANNPVDATPMATTKQFVQAVEAILEDPGVDALVVSAVPVTPALNDLPPDPAGTHGENIYSLSSLPQELIRVFRATSKPVVVAVDSGRIYDDCVVLMQRAGIPVYRKIDRATRALSCYCAGRPRSPSAS